MVMTKLMRRKRIKMRVRRKVCGTVDAPRMSVFRSNREIYVQFIDDVKGVTLCSVSSVSLDNHKGNIEQARLVGKLAAEVALSKSIKRVVFDRNGYKYHGRIQALAEAAREGGLNF